MLAFQYDIYHILFVIAETNCRFFDFREILCYFNMLFCLAEWLHNLILFNMIYNIKK